MDKRAQRVDWLTYVTHSDLQTENLNEYKNMEF